MNPSKECASTKNAQAILQMVLHELKKIKDDEELKLLASLAAEDMKKSAAQTFFVIQTEYIIGKIKTLDINF